MTRFMREFSGSLGEYWQKEAEKELAKVKNDLATGAITIDESGIAYNCIGRVVMEDMLEKIALATDKVDVAATRAAREREVQARLAEYRKNKEPATAEKIAELREAFGTGVKVVDVLTGEKIDL